MGYYACGDGHITFRAENEDEVVKLTENLKEYFTEIDPPSFDSEKSGYYVFVVQTYDKIPFEEDLLDALNELSEHVIEGNIEYWGDEDIIWREHFNPETKTWESEIAKIVYESNLDGVSETLMKNAAEAYIAKYDTEYMLRLIKESNAIENPEEHTELAARAGKILWERLLKDDGYLDVYKRVAETILLELTDDGASKTERR